jgi:AcrR family transcriptional regulator
VPRAKQRTEQLRDHIVQVAVAMLAADGVGGFTARNVAARAQTSPPAVYELFGDKAGLVREVFFEGFRLLGNRFGKLKESGDPRADLIRMVGAFRVFVRENHVLAQVMFSRPFADFDPGPRDLAAGAKVREFIVGRVRRCIDAGIIEGDQTDIAHGLYALAQGLAMQEAAGVLGSSRASANRRWELTIRAFLAGLRPPGPDAASSGRTHRDQAAAVARSSTGVSFC